MALQIQDITIWLIILALFNYFIIYKRNRFLGSLGYFLFGVLMYAVKAEFVYSETTYGMIALFIMLGALVNLIYETVAKWSGRTRKLSG